MPGPISFLSRLCAMPGRRLGDSPDMATHPSVPSKGEVKARGNSFQWLHSDAIICWGQLEFRGAVLQMEMIWVGWGWPWADVTGREERREGEPCGRTRSGNDKPQDCVQNSHNAGRIGEGKGTTYIQGSSHGHCKAW